jgi:hypothetical protein
LPGKTHRATLPLAGTAARSSFLKDRDVNSPPDFRLERKGGESRRTLSLSPPECEGPFASPPFRPETREISLGEHFRRDFAELSRGFFAEFRRAFTGFFSPRFAGFFRRDSPRLVGLFSPTAILRLFWKFSKIRRVFRLGSCSWIAIRPFPAELIITEY